MPIQSLCDIKRERESKVGQPWKRVVTIKRFFICDLFFFVSRGMILKALFEVNAVSNVRGAGPLGLNCWAGRMV